MLKLPFADYQEAQSYFEASIPLLFVENLNKTAAYCSAKSYRTEKVIGDLFGIDSLEGYAARYQQTPPEFFPFARTGGDGIHYGFIIHEEGQPDYPSGEICPMDIDGVMLLSENTHQLFEYLLNKKTIDSRPYLDLLELMGINATNVKQSKPSPFLYNQKVVPAVKPGYHWLKTSDGVGVFAPKEVFFSRHPSYKSKNYNEAEYFLDLADESRQAGLFGSQLYYLKEVFWHGWTNYSLAFTVLKSMLEPYEKLNREHLHKIVNRNMHYFRRKT